MNGTIIKGIGITATVIGMGTTLVTSWVEEKKIDIKIAEKVAEKLAEKGL